MPAFDHGFLAAIEAVRRSLDNAMLDGQIGEERLQTDLISGDLTWEASFALPGEGTPARVRADVTLDWPTWSQAALRSWQLEGDADELPELLMEVVLRVQTLLEPPDVAAMHRLLPSEGPDLGGGSTFRLDAPLLEQNFDLTMATAGWAVELTYEASYEFAEHVITEVSLLGPAMEPLGPWVASLLVQLGDLPLTYRPQHEG